MKIAILTERASGETRVAATPETAKKFAALRASTHPQAQFLWAIFRDAFHYIAFHLDTIADNARDVDLAIRWGYGWKLGPFETWQAAGWKQVAEWIDADIKAGKAMSNAPLPDWVLQRDGVYAEVLGGLKPGTRYVAEQSFLIKADVDKSGASHDH